MKRMLFFHSSGDGECKVNPKYINALNLKGFYQDSRKSSMNTHSLSFFAPPAVQPPDKENFAVEEYNDDYEYYEYEENPIDSNEHFYLQPSASFPSSYHSHSTSTVRKEKKISISSKSSTQSHTINSHKINSHTINNVRRRRSAARRIDGDTLVSEDLVSYNFFIN